MSDLTADLSPDVRIKAAEALELARRTYDNATLSPSESARALAMSSAVVVVVTPEIARPLQARITELEKTLSDNRKLWDESIAQTGAALEQSQRIYAEFVTGQHEEALTRIAELEEEEVASRKRSGEALNTECEQIGEKADEAWRALNPYIARVELLTAALTELVQLYDGTHAMFTTIPRSIACGPITKVFEDAHDRARAALAAGVTESKTRVKTYVDDSVPDLHEDEPGAWTQAPTEQKD